MRFTALSRSLESALQKEGIPSRVLGGHRFFERLEVSGPALRKLKTVDKMFKIKDLLAYLRLIDNPDYNPAFLRAVNVPTRGIGDKVSVTNPLIARVMLTSRRRWTSSP